MEPGWLDRGSQNDADLVHNWILKNCPFIVRRPSVSADQSTVYAGLALPPDPVKRRIALKMPSHLVRKRADPPSWADCQQTSPSPDKTPLVLPIVRAAEAAGVQVRTFGSYAWQFWSGLSYVTPESDIDLLVEIEARKSWRRFWEAISGRDRLHPKIDLEILLAGDASFRWSEFLSASRQILFKANSGVWLGHRSSIEDLLPR
jgi:phosphoribosyl-dephospho-CoA transferase